VSGATDGLGRSECSLEEYLRENERRGVIDHSIRAQLRADGTVTFYIHPAFANGETWDYQVQGNTLLPDPNVQRGP